jgi:membrane-associated phospholipid phosphatase
MSRAPRTTAEPSRPTRDGGRRGWRRPAAQAALGATLLAVSWLLLGEPVDRVPAWESGAFGVLNRLPGTLGWALWPIMQLGSVVMYAVGGTLVYLVTRRVRPAMAAALAVLAGWAASRAVKATAGRERPGALLDRVDLRGSDIDGNGFVSGHTTVAFALATVLTAVLPGRWRWAPFPLAAIVGVARIFYGVHLPLDVTGGAGLGVLCGLVASAACGVHPGRRWGGRGRAPASRPHRGATAGGGTAAPAMRRLTATRRSTRAGPMYTTLSEISTLMVVSGRARDAPSAPQPAAPASP